MSDLDRLAQAAHQSETYGASINYAYPPCNVCGFRGPPRKRSKGSWLAVFLLFVFAVVAGFASPLAGGVLFVVMLLYVVLNVGAVWRCGKCGAKKADA